MSQSAGKKFNFRNLCKSYCLVSCHQGRKYQLGKSHLLAAPWCGSKSGTPPRLWGPPPRLWVPPPRFWAPPPNLWVPPPRPWVPPPRLWGPPPTRILVVFSPRLSMFLNRDLIDCHQKLDLIGIPTTPIISIVISLQQSSMAKEGNKSMLNIIILMIFD